MKKMVLLTGILALGIAGYAAETSSGFEATDSFKAHVNVIKPLTLEVDELLEFGTVAVGQTAIVTEEPINLKITGEPNKNVVLSYLLNGEEMVNNTIIMRKTGSSDTIKGYLVANKEGVSILPQEVISLENGKIEREIYARITRMEDVESGDYYSDPVTIKVQYQ